MYDFFVSGDITRFTLPSRIVFYRYREPKRTDGSFGRIRTRIDILGEKHKDDEYCDGDFSDIALTSGFCRKMITELSYIIAVKAAGIKDNDLRMRYDRPDIDIFKLKNPEPFTILKTMKYNDDQSTITELSRMISYFESWQELIETAATVGDDGSKNVDSLSLSKE